MIELTERQKEAFDLFTEGLSLNEVALKMGVSYSRVINILNEIIWRTGLKNKRELLLKAHSLHVRVKTPESEA